MERMIEIADMIFSEMKQAQAHSKDSTGTGKTLLEVLSNARDEEMQTRLTDEEVKDNALVMLLAGVETTADTMCWTLAQLAQHPSVTVKVCQEIDTVFAGMTAGEQFGHAQVEMLKYFDKVIRETMRIFPPVISTIPRELLVDMTVGDWELKKGTMVTAYANEVHMNQKVWGADADDFRPERFDEQEPGQPSKNPYAWIPFGAGRRTCIGRVLAEEEMRIVLPLLLRELSFKLKEDHPPIEAQFKLIVVQPRSGLFLRFQERMRPPTPE